MKIQFYVLGLLLRYGPQHGYMLMQKVEQQISDFAQIKLPTIYYHLDKLNEKQYISATYEKDGNRPEKTVYSITQNGEKYFYELLKKMQTEELKLDLPLDGVIFFQDRLDKNEFCQSIQSARLTIEAKLNRVIAHRQAVLSVIPEGCKSGTTVIFNHHIYHLEAELEWLKELEKGI
ncbi:MAG: PadR family transcriptional regulator [Aminipila sp.]